MSPFLIDLPIYIDGIMIIFGAFLILEDEKKQLKKPIIQKKRRFLKNEAYQKIRHKWPIKVALAQRSGYCQNNTGRP